MKCRDCRENLVACMEGSLGQAEAGAVLSHVEECPSCGREYRELCGLRQRLHADAARTPEKDFAGTVMARVRNRERFAGRESINMFGFWRRIGLSAAAGLVAAAAVILVVWDHPGKVAYAIEQTIEAVKAVRYMHVKDERPASDVPDKTREMEMWAAFDEQGELVRGRISLSDTLDGPKVVLWENGKGTVYLKAKNVLATVPEKDLLPRLPKELLEAHLDMERLKQAQDAGTAQVRTQEPANAGDPITVTVTYAGTGAVDVYSVDPSTKLVKVKKGYTVAPDGTLQLVSRTQFVEYNKPFDESVWRLDVPAGVTRIDQTAVEVGLPKGGMTNDQVAVEIVKQFFEALIAKDYDKAGRLYGGVPGEVLRKGFSDTEFLRIVSIGNPIPTPENGQDAVRLECKVEVMTGGSWVVRSFDPRTRPMYNQPDRWEIHGGI